VKATKKKVNQDIQKARLARIAHAQTKTHSHAQTNTQSDAEVDQMTMDIENSAQEMSEETPDLPVPPMEMSEQEPPMEMAEADPAMDIMPESPAPPMEMAEKEEEPQILASTKCQCVFESFGSAKSFAEGTLDESGECMC